MIAVAVFAEGEFDHIVDLPSLEQAEGFCTGLQAAANLYGAGSCHGYILPDEHEQMLENESEGEAAKAFKDLGAKR